MAIALILEVRTSLLLVQSLLLLYLTRLGNAILANEDVRTAVANTTTHCYNDQ